MTDVLHPEDDLGVKPDRFRAYFAFLQSELQTAGWLWRECTTAVSRRFTYQMMVLLVMASVMVLMLPFIMGQAVRTIQNQTLETTWVWVLAFAGAAFFLHVISFFEGRAREHMLGKTVIQIDNRITELLFGKALGQHDRHGSTLNYSSIDKGRWKAIGLMEAVVFQCLPALLLVLLSFLGLWYLHPIAGVLATLTICTFLTWSFWLNYHVGHSMHPVEREFRRINRIRVERWEKVHRVITSGMSSTENNILNSDMEINMQKDCTFWVWFIGQFNARAFLTQRLLQVAALCLGTWLVYRGTWHIGLLFPLIMWTDVLSSNLLVISNVERLIGRDIVPIQLMVEALSLPPSFDQTEGERLYRNGPLAIKLENVSHAYRDAKDGSMHHVLKNINLEIKPGEKVALLGPSGAGKTTIMKLLLRFEDPREGSVSVNGKSLTEILLPSYMQQVGYIPQHPMIFDSTLRENLLYGVTGNRRRALSKHGYRKLWELMSALKIDFGPRLTHGLDTLVGRHGLQLSGGQSQRVMIGAAVAKNPRLMIIDEATSNLDSTTEKEVQAGLKQALESGTTALIVAHRLSTVRHLCSRFIVLKPIDELGEGEPQIEAVAESFENLVKISPTFRRLALDQGIVL